MKVVLATGIYPPAIGGPATYCYELAHQLVEKGVEVEVITYVGHSKMDIPNLHDSWSVVGVPLEGGPLLRWWRYRKALRRTAKDADIVYAFSSVSCGVPLMFSGLKKPKKVLRLGGDFFWERYTDKGGMKNLREWYQHKPSKQKTMRKILNSFDHIVFSTDFQKHIYEKHYPTLPTHSVIENALPHGSPSHHDRNSPFRLLFMGRFVGFKNLPALLEAVSELPTVRLTLVGDGPMRSKIFDVIANLGIEQHVEVLPSAYSDEKQKIFEENDLLVIPSLTEISPNVALEARVSGLPVLLTERTGLSEKLRDGMVTASLHDPSEIAEAIKNVRDDYDQIANNASKEPEKRNWEDVADDHVALFYGIYDVNPS